MNEEKNDEQRNAEEFSEEIGKEESRKLKARREKEKSLWYGLGMFGIIGWSVVIPTLIGLAVGLWLDAETDGSVSWTLTFLSIGVALGCLNAWRWVKRESRHD